MQQITGKAAFPPHAQGHHLGLKTARAPECSTTRQSTLARCPPHFAPLPALIPLDSLLKAGSPIGCGWVLLGCIAVLEAGRALAHVGSIRAITAHVNTLLVRSASYTTLHAKDNGVGYGVGYRVVIDICGN